jgi:TrmH family RNA methyltransferase
MISSSKSKLIRSLRQKKFRDQHRLFLAEGEKMVLELVSGRSENPFRILELFATHDWIERNKIVLEKSGTDLKAASQTEIRKVSNLKTPQPVIALVSIPQESIDPNALINTPVLVLESIRDPGNLGTIIRTADWFGIRQIICTPDSTDLFNPKVVQATMGAITRVKVQYMELKAILEKKEMEGRTVFGTFMEGENIYRTNLGQDPLVLFGNESHGLSRDINPYIHKRLTIPSFSPSSQGSESLNVASSVAVVCSELRRQDLIRSGN